MNELRSILLAEDNSKDVELALAALEEHHLANEVVVVGDGAEALDYLYCRGRFKLRTKVLPAVVLLDLKMPKVDGIEVLRTIRKDDQLKTIPVVMLTSSHEEAGMLESHHLGANACMVKPVNFSQLTAAVSHLDVFWAIINGPKSGIVKTSK
jgi:CheY-like chemotaxis protein